MAKAVRCPFQRSIRHLCRIRPVSQRRRGPVADMCSTRSRTSYLRSTKRTQGLWRNHGGRRCPGNIRRNRIPLQALTLRDDDKGSSTKRQHGGQAACHARRHGAFCCHPQRPKWDKDHLVVLDDCKRREGRGHADGFRELPLRIYCLRRGLENADFSRR